MQAKSTEIDQMLGAYHAAVEAWIAAIREEETLASRNSSLAQVDQWEQAHFREEEARNKAKAAKKDYEAALRFKFFEFR
jgi:dsRNA-specific ribonuclease